ncbi:hypothetical protein [Streptomyces sp. NPDC047070]
MVLAAGAYGSPDHRLADGRQGSRLLADVADLLREPGLAML